MIAKIENRRLFPRVDVHVPVRCLQRGTGTDTSTCVLNDISAGGLSFVNQQYLAPETVLNLEVNLLSRVIYTAGKVAWVSSMPHSYRYNVGIEFVEMDPVQKRFISDYVGMRLEQS